jgi:hypothetical protein
MLFTFEKKDHTSHSLQNSVSGETSPEKRRRERKTKTQREKIILNIRLLYMSLPVRFT